MTRKELNERCETLLEMALARGGIHVFFNGTRFTTRRNTDPKLDAAIERAGPRYLGHYDIACDARWLLADMREQLRFAR